MRLYIFLCIILLHITSIESSCVNTLGDSACTTISLLGNCPTPDGQLCQKQCGFCTPNENEDTEDQNGGGSDPNGGNGGGTDEIDVDCVGDFGNCHLESCVEIYIITVEKQFNGKDCDHENEFTQPCEEFSQCDQNCIGSFSTCDPVSCTETFQISTASQNNGDTCTFQDGDTRTCSNFQDCDSYELTGTVNVDVQCPDTVAQCTPYIEILNDFELFILLQTIGDFKQTFYGSELHLTNNAKILELPDVEFVCTIQPKTDFTNINSNIHIEMLCTSDDMDDLNPPFVFVPNEITEKPDIITTLPITTTHSGFTFIPSNHTNTTDNQSANGTPCGEKAILMSTVSEPIRKREAILVISFIVCLTLSAYMYALQTCFGTKATRTKLKPYKDIVYSSPISVEDDLDEQDLYIPL